MKIYILAQGERVWRAVENEWKHPLDDNNKAKGRADWSEEELKENKNKSFSNNQESPSFAPNQSVNPKKKGNPNLDGIQCYECKRYGHIQSECPNYLRKKNKTYVTTLSDDSDSEEENNTNFVAFFTNHEGDDESKEDMQDLLNSYTQLHAKWEEIIKVNLNLMQENHFLKSEKEKEILLHKETQEKLMKSLKEKDKLLQEIRRLTENAIQPDLATRKDSVVENREVLQHHFQHRRRIKCYYYHRLGHIKAHCYKRQNDLHNRIWAKQEQKLAQRVWKSSTKNMRSSKRAKTQVPRRGTSQYDDTSSSPAPTYTGDPATIVMDPVPISQVPFQEIQESRASPIENPPSPVT
nr:histone H2B.V2-like [Ipomoea batatas]